MVYDSQYLYFVTRKTCYGCPGTLGDVEDTQKSAQSSLPSSK